MSELTRVKLVAAMLYRDENDLQRAFDLLEQAFSAVDYRGSFFPFVETDYYEEEMGAGLKRGMISFRDLVHPGFLAESKQISKSLEQQLAGNEKRTVNIDIGYLDVFKLVLASFKGRSNKIYLSDGIWADMICYFEQGDFKTFLWGFPDFKSGIYNKDLIEIRSIYKKQIRQKQQ